ncbi:uncharacterized protein TNCV_4579651 [Trichonephila clavipes]|nr:uncharacterized protein TNCV_4579651 [Trichonephila clavipes]
MPKSNALRGKEFREKKKLAANPVEKVTKKKIIQIHQVQLPNLHQSVHEKISSTHTSTKKTLQNTLLMPSLMTNRKIVQIHQVLLPNFHQSTHERIWHGKNIANSVLMPSLRDGDAIETLLMTAKINTDFVNHPVPSTREPSTSIVRVGTDECETIINSILRYKDYDFHKNAWPW